MGLRELKEAAHAQYLRGRFEQCAQTYRQILRLAPKDPNVRVRHAEACRRAGDRQQAIASYRAAADLLLAVGCESRARGALKAALELDPKDPVLLADLARLGQSGPASGLDEERPHGSHPTPGVLEPWEPHASPAGRSMTSAGVPAARSMTLAGLPAARSVSAGSPAPRSMTSASLPAVRSLAAGNPAPRAMSSAGAPAIRSMTSAGTPAVGAPEALARRALPIAPAGPVYRPPSVAPVQPPVGRAMPPPPPASAQEPVGRATPPPLPASAQDPVWASHGMPPPLPKHGAASAVLSQAMQGALHGTLSSASTGASGSPPPFRVTPASVTGGGALPPRGASAFHEAAPGAPAYTVSATPPPGSAPTVRLQAEVRRLGPNALAFRLTAQSRWVLFTSSSPIQVRRVDSLEEAQKETRDFSLDITVEEPERLDVESLH